MLEADNLEVMDWHVDASFAVHPDMKGHTGGTMTLGKGSIIAICRKQQFNTRSSTEAKIVGVDKCIGKMEWTKISSVARDMRPQRSSTRTT